MIVQPPGFLRSVADLCRRFGVLFIADEVAVGFGRTGKMFACEAEDVAPDLMALGKALAAGYLPLAATLATESIYEGFLGDAGEGRTFYHGHTFTGNPLAASVAARSLELFESERLIEALPARIELVARKLERFREHASVGDVRQCGMLAGIELIADRHTREPFPPQLRMGHRVTVEARRRGLVTRPLGDVLILMPVLAADDTTLSDHLDILYESLEAAAPC
jgi:adenosylmethionine-8-amino-7-oxononanoate aminotransferase